jgi:septal ring factor EnvC (AmiA/AmiB activator)
MTATNTEAANIEALKAEIAKLDGDMVALETQLRALRTERNKLDAQVCDIEKCLAADGFWNDLEPTGKLRAVVTATVLRLVSNKKLRAAHTSAHWELHALVRGEVAGRFSRWLKAEENDDARRAALIKIVAERCAQVVREDQARASLAVWNDLIAFADEAQIEILGHTAQEWRQWEGAGFGR